MNLRNRVVQLGLSAAVVVVVAACGKTPPPPPPQPAVPDVALPSAADLARAKAKADSLEMARLRREQIARDSVKNVVDAQNKQREADDAAAADAANRKAAMDAADAATMRATLQTLINFEYDRAVLSNDAKVALDAKIPILNANPSVTLRIAGHTDNRGSGEYNLQLGQRRAAAARDYLTARGVSASRIELVSYGEERPLCQADDDACWAQNRRAEFEITAGGTTLKKP